MNKPIRVARLVIAGALLGLFIQLVISGTPDAHQPPPFSEPPTPVISQAPPQEIAPSSPLFPDLIPPEDGAATAEWLAFLQQLKATDTGTRFSASDYTTPLLPWFNYVARKNPQAIYQYFGQQPHLSRIVSHLIEYGYLPDWYEQLPNARRMLLTNSEVVKFLSLQHGVDYTRKELIAAIREQGDAPFKADSSQLQFAMVGMDREERLRLFSRISSGDIKIDPRGVRGFERFPEIGSQREALLATMEINALDSRSMSSFFLHGAELGESRYVEELLKDVTDNNKQPLNFYCAACYLALVSDGLLGRALVNELNSGRIVKVRRIDHAEPLDHRASYLYALTASKEGE